MERQRLYRFADEYVRQRAIADGFVPHANEGGICVRRYSSQDKAILHSKHGIMHEVNVRASMTEGSNAIHLCAQNATRESHKNYIHHHHHHHHPQRQCESLVAVAAVDHLAGAVVVDTTGVLLPIPLQSTIAVPGVKHLRLTGGAEFIRHSCLPNLRLELDSNSIRGIALRPIEAGEILTYNYLCTEWEMASVFHCSCNVYCCYGVIKGFKYLDKEQQQHLLPHCSPAVKSLYFSTIYAHQHYGECPHVQPLQSIQCPPEEQHEENRHEQSEREQSENEHKKCTSKYEVCELMYIKYDVKNFDKIADNICEESTNGPSTDVFVSVTQTNLPAGTVLYTSGTNPVEVSPDMLSSFHSHAKINSSVRLSSTSASVNFNGAVKLTQNNKNNENVVNHDDNTEVNEIVVYHSCHPTAAIINNRLVLRCDVTALTAITVNMNELFYRLEYPFTCNCLQQHSCEVNEAENDGNAKCSSSTHANTNTNSNNACKCGDGNFQIQGFAALSDVNKDAIILCTSPEVRATAVADGYHNKSSSPLVKIEEYGGFGQATFATQPITRGSIFFHVTGLVLPFPTIYTIMLGDDHHHLLFADGAQCLAHSCEPNVEICILPEHNALYCKALRDIDANELISFNYNTTEWDMSTPFPCSCHSPLCAGQIRGFKHLSILRRQVLLPSVTEAICSLSGWTPVHTFQLPTVLSTTSNKNQSSCNVSYLQTACLVPRGTVLLSFFPLEIQKDHITIGGKYIVSHDAIHFNCVYVEGRLITFKTLLANDRLRINMNFCIYDIANYLLSNTSSNNNGGSKQNTERACTRGECASQLCTGFKYMSEALKQQYLYLCEPDVRATAMHDGWTVTSSQSLLRVIPNGMMGQAAFATTDIPPNVTLFHCTGLIVPFPTMYTICIGKDQHLLFGDAAECIAHHCDPNVRVVVNATNNVCGNNTENINCENDDDDDDDEEQAQSLDFVTIKLIKAGELITFNYNTTEWVMNSPFTCVCQSPECAKVIQGFKHLSKTDQERIWDITTDYVKTESALYNTKYAWQKLEELQKLITLS